MDSNIVKMSPETDGEYSYILKFNFSVPYCLAKQKWLGSDPLRNTRYRPVKIDSEMNLFS